MSKEKFTPSPWFRKGKRVYWKKPDKDLPRGTLPNGLICTCKSAEDWPECNEEARANAALIAAAPELYDALADATRHYCSICRNEPIEIENLVKNGCPKTRYKNLSYPVSCIALDWLNLLKKVRAGE